MTKTMGEVVAWSAGSNSMNRNDFITLMHAQSLPIDLPPRDRIRVVERALKGYLQSGRLIQLGTDSWRIGYAIIEETKDLQDAVWNAKASEVITYWKRSGKVTFKKGTRSDLIPVVRKAIDNSTYNVFTADISRAIGVCLRKQAAGMQIASAGGTWFIPHGASEVVDSVEYVIDRVAEIPGNDITLYRFPVKRTPRNVRNIRALCERSISKMINDAALKALMMLRGRQRSVRYHAIYKRIQRAKEFMNRIELVEDILGARLVQQREDLAEFNDIIEQMKAYKIGE